MSIKDLTNDELLKEFERSLIHCTVTECNTRRGTKSINDKIDKIRTELLNRLNNS